MTRINAFRSIAETRSMTWGKNTSTLIFAAVLIVCSVTVGCSSDKPKPVSSNNQVPAPQPVTASTPMPAPVVEAAAKPAPRKIVHKKPATVNYTDKAYGVTFEYPRRYAIETGNAATELMASNPIAMNFVQPGGLALAAVELPETGFANTDFSSAFFNVSINKSLTADQCTEFAVPQPKAAPQASTTDAAHSCDTCFFRRDVRARYPVGVRLEAHAGRPRTARHRGRHRGRHSPERLEVLPCLPEWSLLRVRLERDHRRL